MVVLVATIGIVAGNRSAAVAADQAGIISTVAGNTASDGRALDVGQRPEGVFASATDVWVNDERYCALRHIDRVTNLETTVLQNPQEISGSCPFALGLDDAGRVLISRDHELLRREADGQLTRIAGTGTAGEPSPADDGRPATSVALGSPTQAVGDRAGGLYFVDVTWKSGIGDEAVVGHVDAAGTYRTVVAADGSTPGAATSPAAGRISYVWGLAVTVDDRLHIAVREASLGFPGSGGVLDVVEPDGTFHAETGRCTGRTPELGPLTCFSQLTSLSAEPDGGLLIGDWNTVKRLTPDGTMSVVAGMPEKQPDDRPNPVATQAQLGSSLFASLTPEGGFYVADYYSQRIHYVSPTGELVPVAGDGTTGTNIEGGPAVASQISWPTAMATDPVRGVYVADQLANRVRLLTPDGRMQTVVGTGRPGVGGDGGPALAAQLYGPHKLAVGPDGSLYIAAGYVASGENPWWETYDQDRPATTIRKVAPDGTISTLAGGATSDVAAPEGGSARYLHLGTINGLTVDAGGNVYLTSWNPNVRYAGEAAVIRIDRDGNWHRFAGFGADSGYTGYEQPALTAVFGRVQGLLAAPQGGVYLSRDQVVDYVSPDGILHPFAGRGWSDGSGYGPAHTGDGGPASAATIGFPTDLVRGHDGSIYIADPYVDLVRRVTPDGRISTVAGNGNQDTQHGHASPDGVPATSVPLWGADSIGMRGDQLLIGEAEWHSAIRGVTLTPFTATPTPTPTPTTTPTPTPTPIPIPQPVSVTVTGPSTRSTVYGRTVPLAGTAPAGATVSVWFHEAGTTGYVQGRTLTASSTGAWNTSYVANDDYRVYAAVGHTQSPPVLVQVAPTINGAAAQTVKRNSTVTVAGTGIPRATITLHFHQAGTPSTDYSILRTVPVAANGTWTRPYVASVDYRYFASLPNGLMSGNYLTQAR